MNRPLFIILGISMVVILVGVWVYLVFFNDKEVSSSDTYTDLNIGDTTDNTYTPSDPVVDTSTPPIVDTTGPERIRQLTTRPVVGYQEVIISASSTPLVYYVESGTGHVYSISLKTGEEKRVSGTTIPASAKAAITPNGHYVLIQSGTGSGEEFIVGAFSTSSESLTTGLIEEAIISFTDTTENTFLYAVKKQSSVVGKEYNPATGKTTTLFTIPFREAAIAWGSSASEPHYIYPKASNRLEGYLYMAENGVIDRLPIGGYGLSASGNTDGVVYSQVANGIYKSFVYDTEKRAKRELPIPSIPEKCVPQLSNSTNVVCASALYAGNTTGLPDTWYKGSNSFNDSLWLVYPTTGVVENIANIESETGRQLDVINLRSNKTDTRLYFTNGSTGNLWLFAPTE